MSAVFISPSRDDIGSGVDAGRLPFTSAILRPLQDVCCQFDC